MARIYIIVKEPIQKLEQEVNDLMETGYIPICSPFQTGRDVVVEGKGIFAKNQLFPELGQAMLLKSEWDKL